MELSSDVVRRGLGLHPGEDLLAAASVDICEVVQLSVGDRAIPEDIDASRGVAEGANEGAEVAAASVDEFLVLAQRVEGVVTRVIESHVVERSTSDQAGEAVSAVALFPLGVAGGLGMGTRQRVPSRACIASGSRLAATRSPLVMRRIQTPIGHLSGTS